MQYTRLLGSDTVPLLQALVATHGDEHVTLLVLDPEPSYYRQFGHSPAVRIDPAALTEHGFWEAVANEPGGDAAGALVYSADVVAIVGSTRTWSIWGERDCDLALVHSPTTAVGWTEVDSPPLVDDGREALWSWVEPEFRGQVPDAFRTTFLRNLATRGVLG
jgi:hypothetical protein